MNIEQAKAIPLAQIFETLDIKSAKNKGDESWYLSPLRSEKTASFKVNHKLNLWYDFGEGVGGNSISFAIAWLKSRREDHTVRDALRWLANMSGGPLINAAGEPFQKPEPVFVLKSVKEIENIALIRYLEKRGIPHPVARMHLKEVCVINQENGKTMFALGLKNEDEGYELRNPFFKGSVGAKDISFIRGHSAGGIHFFEGMMDFLSVATQQDGKPLKDDAIILNSVSNLRRLPPYIRGYGYKLAYSWMDNDKAGEKATAILAEFIESEDGLTLERMNGSYAPHKDVNGWHMHSLGLSLGEPT